MTTFSIQKGHAGREVLAIRLSAEKLGSSCVFESEASPGTIPIGTVEYCEPLFGRHIKAFYPCFLLSRLHRGTGFLAGSDTLVDASFVKDATAWKSDWESKVYPAGMVIPKGEWWVSEPVRFLNEWRYYVASGRVVATGWYAGEDEDLPAPDTGVSWPAGFSGAVDFGSLPDGRLALVECHAPFACGWYGDRHEDYARWQIEAWENSSWWR